MKNLNKVLFFTLCTLFATNSFAQDLGIFGIFKSRNDQRQSDIRSGGKNYFDKLKEANDARKESKKQAKDLLQNAEAANDTIFDSRVRAELEKKLDSNRILRRAYAATIDDIESSFQLNLIDIFESQQVKQFNPVLLPGRNSFTTMLYYNSLNSNDWFKESNLNIGTDNASFSTDVVSWYAGIAKFSVSSVISKAQVRSIDNSKVGDVTSEQLDSLVRTNDSVNRANSEITKVISGGGELGLKVKAPLLDITGRNGNRLKYNINAQAILNGNLDLPSGANFVDMDKASFFYSAGVDLNFFVPLYNFEKTGKYTFDKYQAIALCGKLAVKLVDGSEKFHQNLGINTAFFTQEFNVGAAWKNIFFYYNRQVINVDKFQNRSRFTISFIQSI